MCNPSSNPLRAGVAPQVSNIDKMNGGMQGRNRSKRKSRIAYENKPGSTIQISAFMALIPLDIGIFCRPALHMFWQQNQVIITIDKC